MRAVRLTDLVTASNARRLAETNEKLMFLCELSGLRVDDPAILKLESLLEAEYSNTH